MANYQLSIVTPEGQVFDDQIESLIAPGMEGSFGVLANHAPMVSTLKDGLLKIRRNGQESSVNISEGILEVDNEGNVLLLSNTADLKQ